MPTLIKKTKMAESVMRKPSAPYILAALLVHEDKVSLQAPDDVPAEDQDHH